MTLDELFSTINHHCPDSSIHAISEGERTPGDEFTVALVNEIKERHDITFSDSEQLVDVLLVISKVKHEFDKLTDGIREAYWKAQGQNKKEPS